METSTNMDISSDSEDTVIMPLIPEEPSDTEIEKILKKYSTNSTTSLRNSPHYSTDESSEESFGSSLFKKQKKGDDDDDDMKMYDCEKGKNRFSFNYLLEPADNVGSAMDLDSEEILKELSNKYTATTSRATDVIVLSDGSDKDEPKRHRDIEKKKKDKASEKKRKQEEAEKRRAMRNMEKERKKEEAARQKALKTALKSVEQSTKPDECIKHMIVELAPETSQKEYGELLKTTLRSSDIPFRSTPQVLPNLVSWTREIQMIENMVVKNTEVKEKHFLLIMDKSEFLENIRKNSLKDHIKTIWNLINFKMLTIAVLGLSKVTADQDLAVMEAQMLLKCYFRYLKQAEDLATLLLEVTKAIAQIPHKAKKEEKYKLQTEYFNDSNKDTVRVDKNGNGLGRLWQQMLTMFPLARLETAEAITAAYPTPDSLFKAYDDCQSNKEELLQDLPIRRALGPCTSVRRIGPELSKKCSTFFCSKDNVLL